MESIAERQSVERPKPGLRHAATCPICSPPAAETFSDLTMSLAADGAFVVQLSASFSVEVARRVVTEHGRAKMIVGHTLLHEVADVDELVGGIPLLLAWNGTVSFEISNFRGLIEVERTLAGKHLRLFDGRLIPGPSLLVFGCHLADPRRETLRLREVRGLI